MQSVEAAKAGMEAKKKATVDFGSMVRYSGYDLRIASRAEGPAGKMLVSQRSTQVESDSIWEMKIATSDALANARFVFRW
jgi:hypothetical protein